jgi:DNA-binding MarR family transcriptional regulator
MSALSQMAEDLDELMLDILKQFDDINLVASNGPHAELSHQELRLIQFLGNTGPHMMRELAEKLSVAMNTVTGIVDKLERGGFVLRQRCENDRRVIWVVLTHQGRQIYRSEVDLKRGLFENMLATLTTEEQEQFLVLMRKIAFGGGRQVYSRQPSS